MAAAYHIIGEKYITAASEDFEQDLSQPAPNLHVALRNLVHYYVDEMACYDDSLTSFESFQREMDMPIAPGQLPLWQQAFQNLRLDNEVARNALPEDAFVAAARTWLGLINGLEPRGCGDHGPVFRLKLLDQNGVNLLPYNYAFENNVRRWRHEAGMD
eukprot:TRINITY_DN7621_c0_g2_i1.p1 TRINITY_DN7621_c0_g2~~TRINITY_DN7621_c0_g2_i1.p1  ORF type:complete len:158 (-),score=39.59 TRINITY_DN7621_c0_g2_i1:115-588(-)